MNLFRNLLIDRKHRLPREWSNEELRKIAPHFKGDIVNVSGWKDIDKEGKRYKDYFTKAKSYTITNYKSEARGYQGFENEIFLDLEQDLPKKMENNFDVVFSHTVLEHIYEFNTAFINLCKMSKDTVIIVVPFLQHMHSDYGDYWRFSPISIKNLFEDNGLEIVYLNFNKNYNASVYIFAVASKKASKWEKIFGNEFTFRDESKLSLSEPNIGCNAIQNSGLKYRRSILNFINRITVNK